MELKEFIKSTIRDITESVSELQNEDTTGAKINPRGVSGVDKIFINTAAGGTHVSLINIEFNVSLTEGEKTDIKSGIGVFFGGVGVGLNAKNGNDSTSYTSIKFSIPLMLPEKLR